MMIPKRLHLIWLGGPRLPRYDADEYWHLLLDDSWAIKVWGDDDDWPVSDKVRDVLDAAETFAPKDDAVRWRTDILRLALLYTYGGVYLDLDAVPLRSIDPLAGDRDAWLAESPNKQGLPTNAAMGFPAKHRMLAEMLDNVNMRASKHARKRTAVAVGGGWLNELLPRYRDVELLPWWLFASRSIVDRRTGKAGDVRNREFGYTAHLYENTARKERQ